MVLEIKPKIKNIYVVAAHLDDIEIGLYTYLKRLIQDPLNIINLSIYIGSLGLDTKPMDLNKARRSIFYKNLETLRLPGLSGFSGESQTTGSILCTVSEEARDLEFPEHFQKLHSDIEQFIKNNYTKNQKENTENMENKENIFIYNAKDIHRDHSTINDICNVIARPITQGGMYDFQEVINFNIPNNDYRKYGMEYGPSQNSGGIFLELTKEEIKNKQKIINNYFHAGILRNKVKKKELKIERLNLIYKRY